MIMGTDHVPRRADMRSMVEILYALAISASVSLFVDKIANDSMRLMSVLPFALTTLCIAIVDWIIFHYDVEVTRIANPYQIVNDFLYPVLIYVLAAAVIHASTFFFLAWIYFALNLAYEFKWNPFADQCFGAQSKDLRTSFRTRTWIGFSVCSICLLLVDLLGMSRALASWIILVVTVLAWGGYMIKRYEIHAFLEPQGNDTRTG